VRVVEETMVRQAAPERRERRVGRLGRAGHAAGHDQGSATPRVGKWSGTDLAPG
jgi:hypothetical protein